MKKNKKDIYSSSLKDFENNKKSGTLNINSHRILKLIGKIFVCFILLSIIMFSIVVTALTVYVMKATDTQSDINLEKQSIVGSEHTKIFGENEKGENVKLNVIDSGVKRIWVDIADVPQIVKDAVVVTEDHKFYQHDGVDFFRTFGAFSNMFLHFWSSNQGGSTITQQLLKNITGERDVHGIKGISRKINEIYKAMSLEKRYSKDQILQAYLNIIYVGHGNYVGIATAAKLYFNKDLKDIKIEEAACLAAMIRNPGRYDMLKNKDKIFHRRNYVIDRLYELGKITKQEAEKAKKTPVIVHRGNINKDKQDEYQSYFVDSALNEVVSRYMKSKKIEDWNVANEHVKKSGLKIYTTIDIDMQKRLESEYEKLNYPKNIQSAFVIFDLNGNMKACVGGVGKKPVGDRSTINYATSHNSLIGPGSTMKAFVYGYEVDKNNLTYSSLFKDAPCKVVQGKPWPENIGDKHTDKMVTVYQAVKKSYNTVAVRALETFGKNEPRDFCSFLKNKLNFWSIVEAKNRTKDGRADDNSAIAMGSLTQGVSLSVLTNAFQIFANGGTFRKGTTLKKVYAQSGEEILETDNKTTPVISKDSSAVVNRLLRGVIVDGGTGVGANLDSMSIEVVGKTGTSNDGKNLTFVGATPHYVAGIWIGSTNGKDISKSGIRPASVWGNIMKNVLRNKDKGGFSTVAAKEQIYCSASGLLANGSCPKKEKGYYKRDNYLEQYCNIHR